MTENYIPTLVLIAGAAVLAPIVSEQTRGLRIPSVVIELIFGIIIGPDVLKLAKATDVTDALANIGLTFLMFLAGFELDLQRIVGRPLNRAAVGWVISLGLALAFSFALVATGFALNTLIIGLSLTTTALGTLLPVLTDAGALSTPFGALVLGVGTVGEFGPVMLVAVLLTGSDPGASVALLVAFIVIATITALLATRVHPPKFIALLRRHMHSSAQLPVRVSVFLVLVLVYLASELGLDVLLGAFSAGIVVSVFTHGTDRRTFASKLDAIGFGFLIPIFFIVSGTRFDLNALLNKPSTSLRLLLFVVLLLIVRGLPAMLLYVRDTNLYERISLALFSATGLPLIVVITTIGTSEGKMRPENAAALVGAGVVSVLVFPATGLRLLRRSADAKVDVPRTSESTE